MVIFKSLEMYCYVYCCPKRNSSQIFTYDVSIREKNALGIFIATFLGDKLLHNFQKEKIEPKISAEISRVAAALHETCVQCWQMNFQNVHAVHV